MTPVVRLSIISPVFHSAPIVDDLVRRITAAASSVTEDFEIILIDDASPDDSWVRIVAAGANDYRVKGIRLTRNFGQHQAITAGLANAHGDYVIVMDCDLQDDPRYIPTLVGKAKEGFDVVLTRRERRQSWTRKMCAKMFFRVFNALTDSSPVDSRIGGYSLISRKAVNSFLRFADVHRQYLLIVSWMGFKQATVSVDQNYRAAGRSSYTFRRLIRIAQDRITSQTTKLLQISIGIGFAYVVAAVIGIACLINGYFHHGYLTGWASTIVLLLASTGLILVGIGILGIYLGNVFDQVRAHPLYLVQEHSNFAEPPR